jgi:Domain of unknown function (DUF4136)
MMRIGGLMILLLFVAQGRPATGKVNSSYDKTAAFATFKTYGWIAGQPAFDPAAHKAIVSAIDAEMTALGLKKVEGRAGDVTLRYLAVRSTSVDLEKLEAIEKQGGDAAGANYTVGRLVIVMEDAKSSRRLWAADGIERLNPGVADRDQTIAGVVARMFETYPTRAKTK